MLGRWRKRGEQHCADKQQGDLHALDREGDPRGGEQAPAYRFARPETLVEAEGTAMSGPGGAPEDPLDAEERRERDRAS